MDIKQLLQGIDCACGKKHTCPIDFVAVERGAAKHLETLCRKQKTLLIVADENTLRAAGEEVMSSLSDKTIKKVIFPGFDRRETS